MGNGVKMGRGLAADRNMTFGLARAVAPDGSQVLIMRFNRNGRSDTAALAPSLAAGLANQIVTLLGEIEAETGEKIGEKS